MSKKLFEALTLKTITLKNRIVVSPMCQYTSTDGFANEWHLIHLGSRAVGGAGLVFTEAAAVTEEGRISPEDLGIWKDEHISKLKDIADFIKAQDAVPGIQLAHAGRKASTYAEWRGKGEVPIDSGGWQVVAPSDIPFSDDYPQPRALERAAIKSLVSAFKQASIRALKAGFEIIEIHAAHGYLLHQFLSPLSNQRDDEYGGSFENRSRLLLEVVDAVRNSWPEDFPLFVRISATDWEEGGWDLNHSIQLASILKKKGVDVIDVSSGGSTPKAKVPAGPGYQVPFASRIKASCNIKTGAVGMITSAVQAETILTSEDADLIFIARELLRNPYWPLQAAKELAYDLKWPDQYRRAK